jgi:hypothetical protein
MAPGRGRIPMMDQQTDVVRTRIRDAIDQDLTGLQPWLRAWVSAHLIDPHPVTLVTDPDTGAHARFWLVTDHVGLDDSAMRVVWDEAGFGLETTLDDGVSYLARRARSFADAVTSL